MPPRREGKITILGRSGYYGGVTGNVYDERSESILCTFKCPAGKTVPEICREIAYGLSGTGRLAYDREPDKYYTASVSGSPPMEQHLKYGEFTLTRNYNPPFTLGQTVTQQIAAGENPVYYQGTAETPCLIVLRNLSDTDILNVTITAINGNMLAKGELIEPLIIDANEPPVFLAGSVKRRSDIWELVLAVEKESAMETARMAVCLVKS